jgi:hypothetical protein
LPQARREGKRLGQVLIERGLVTAEDVVRLVAEQRGLPFLDIAAFSVDGAMRGTREILRAAEFARAY